jgi:prevent-host-death family protein
MRHVSLREANQHLSRYVQAAEQGEEIIITRRGQPVVKITAIGNKRVLSEEQQAALDRLRKRMQEGHSLGGERFDRDAAHER